MTYDHTNIEPKWQKKWEKEKMNRAVDTDTREKYYILDMFPYPSGAGLHVGHPEGYTATDIIARYKRMMGFNVLHPMGWDAFGLPAENYAIKTGVHPDKSTTDNIKTFTRQIKSLGFSYDWDREISTCSPEYYHWTQWIFLQMYNHGLAYKKKGKVNWCDTDQTVLANEQVINGKCDRCGNQVVQKDLEQWFFKVTDYAEQLLRDLDSIDWPEPIKLMQKNWIGKSEGAEIDFQVDGHKETITVFTTRPDTIFGATYMVLSPEHPLVKKLTTKNHEEAVKSYQEVTKKKSDLQRTDLNKDKSGVFTGAFAINPANEEKIPIWIADYVLMTYGTGAIMAVPAHDERDLEFAKKYDLPITIVIELEKDILIDSGKFSGMKSGEAKTAIVNWLGKMKRAKAVTQYRLRDWLISRQRYWGSPIPIVYDPQGKAHAVKEEHLPLLLPTDVDYRPKGTSPLGSSHDYAKLAEKLYGKGWHFEHDTMDTFVCSSWYQYRYIDPQNEKTFADKKLLKKWLPVDMYVGGAEHAVLHLLYARFFHKALQDFGLIPGEVGREPFKALRNQGIILGEDSQKMSKSRGNVVNPDEIVEKYGADSLRLYEMFMGPFEQMKPWSMKGVEGVYRFLQKVWRLSEKKMIDTKMEDTLATLVHKTIKKVTSDIETFGFNTAISQMMICVNEMTSLESLPKEAYEKLLLVLSPFAPHLTEELWSMLGHKKSIFLESWPKFDEALTIDNEVDIAVQVNGKLRGSFKASREIAQNDALEMAKSVENVKAHLEGKKIMKEIYVPGKIVNIVIQ